MLCKGLLAWVTAGTRRRRPLRALCRGAAGPQAQRWNAPAGTTLTSTARCHDEVAIARRHWARGGPSSGATSMSRAAFLAAAVATLAAAPAAPSAAQEHAPTPPYWAVTGVRSDDVLHLRDMPDAES